MDINEKNLEKILKEQREDYQRYLGVLAEDFESKTDLIAEQYLDIKKTLDFHTETLDSHTEMIGKLTVDMEIVKTDIEFMKNSLKRKVDLEEFEALEKRVLRLEKFLTQK
jgi:hypothetical protein